jgi:hypothetical protein
MSVSRSNRCPLTTIDAMHPLNAVDFERIPSGSRERRDGGTPPTYSGPIKSNVLREADIVMRSEYLLSTRRANVFVPV